MDVLPNDLYDIIVSYQNSKDTCGALKDCIERLKKDVDLIDDHQKSAHWLFRQLLQFQIFQNDKKGVVDCLLNQFKSTDDKNHLAVLLYLLETIISSDNPGSKSQGYDTQDLIFLSQELVQNQVLSLLRQGIMEEDAQSVLNHPSIRLLYEICCQTRLTRENLNHFDQEFIDSLFSLVEKTRNLPEEQEDYNFSIIRLILSLNDQFIPKTIPTENPIVKTVGERLNNSKTLSENILFMFNRGEDATVQILIQKLLYLLFNNPKTCNWFYTNDLNVILDVILRETRACSRDQVALQQGYIRILEPLLRYTPLLTSASFSKHDDVKALLMELIQARPEDVDPTVQRLAERTWRDCQGLLDGELKPEATSKKIAPPLPKGPPPRGPPRQH